MYHSSTHHFRLSTCIALFSIYLLGLMFSTTHLFHTLLLLHTPTLLVLDNSLLNMLLFSYFCCVFIADLVQSLAPASTGRSSICVLRSGMESVYRFKGYIKIRDTKKQIEYNNNDAHNNGGRDCGWRSLVLDYIKTWRSRLHDFPEPLMPFFLAQIPSSQWSSLVGRSTLGGNEPPSASLRYCHASSQHIHGPRVCPHAF
jgi:hypothetical protein